MSIEILPTLEKEVDVKKKGTSQSSQTSKKEGGMSLFDSLLKDAKGDESATLDTKKEKSATKNLDTQNQTKTTAVVKTGKSTETKELSVDKNETKQLADELVEIVVEKAKSIKEKTKLLEDESKVKEKVVELKEDVKQNVKEKTKTIKDSVEEIKKAVDNIQDEKIDESSKTVKKEVGQITEIKKVTSEVTETVKEKTKAIKESVEDIQKSVSKLIISSEETTVETDVKGKIKAQEKELNDKNVEIIKSKVDKKTTEITDAVEKIDENIDKLQGEDSSKAQAKAQDVALKESKPKEKIEVKQVDEKILNDKNVDTESLKVEIVESTKQIKEAVDEIEKTVSKVNFVSTDEIVKSIQELKKELQNPKVKVNVTQEDNTQNNSVKTAEKASILANALTQEQQNSKIQTSLQQVADAKKNIEDKKSVGAVKQSANMLDLNPEEVAVENIGEQGEKKAELFAKNTKEFNQNFYNQKSFNRVIIENKLQTQEINENEFDKISAKTNETTTGSSESQNSKQTTITMNVPQNVVETIQSKIIGAQQRMGSFMSDVARNMYLNYKPPFTSFKMSLNPANLGSISIVMRANKADNSISVSMNMTNSNTMETFADNKSTLQNAIQKQLGEDSNVSLNFGMDSGSDSSDFESFQNETSRDNNSNSSQIIGNQVEEVEEETKDTLSYM